MKHEGVTCCERHKRQLAHMDTRMQEHLARFEGAPLTNTTHNAIRDLIDAVLTDECRRQDAGFLPWLPFGNHLHRIDHNGY